MKKFVFTLWALSLLVFSHAFAAGESEVKEKLKALKPKDFPTQPIEFMVVYPAGGGMDVTARILAKYVEKYTDHRAVVINKTGGAGLIGHTYLATQAKNDGYTVGILYNGFLDDELNRAKGKWSYEDMESLAFILDDPMTWLVSTAGPLKDKSLQEVIDLAKKNPGKFKIANLPESMSQFLLDDIEMACGAKFMAVPFQGGKPGIIALVGGHVDIAPGFSLGEFKDYLEAGQVKVIAATGAERHFYFPKVPTFNEVLGVNHILWSAWRFVCVPKGVPRDRFRYLEAAIDAALHDPECIKDFEKIGTKVGLKYMNGRQTQQELAKKYSSLKEFFRKRGRIAK